MHIVPQLSWEFSGITTNAEFCFFWHRDCVVQGVLLKVLVGLGLIKSHHFWVEVEQLEEALQNVLVCLEMIVFSVIHQYAFHVAPYSGETEAKMRMSKRDWFWDRRPFSKFRPEDNFFAFFVVNVNDIWCSVTNTMVINNTRKDWYSFF